MRVEYEKNFQELNDLLNQLDQKVTRDLQDLTSRAFITSHPAFAYFCKEYHLTQISVECEGKDPTPYQLDTILRKARAAHIDKIYVQIQYSSKGARLFAQELGAKVITLDPYAEDYIPSMLAIAHAFSSQ